MKDNVKHCSYLSSYKLRRISHWFRDEVFRRLFLNAGRLIGANSITTGLGFIVTMLTARALGPENFGVLALVLVYAQVIGKLVTFHAWVAIVKFGDEALHKNDRSGFRQLIKLGFCLDLSSAILGTVLAISFSGLIIDLLGWDRTVQPLIVLYSILILFTLNGTPIGVLRIYDRFDILSYTGVITALIRLCGVIICLLFGQGLYGFVLVYLIAEIIGQFYQIITSLWVLHVQEVGNFLAEPLRGLGQRFSGIWKYVWSTNLNQTIKIVSRQGDSLLVAGLTTPADLGFYTIAKRIAKIMGGMSDPFFQSIYPELTRLWAASKKKEFVALIKRTTFILSGVALIIWLSFIVIGHPLIKLAFGTSYQASYILAVIYMFARVIAVCAFALGPALVTIGLPGEWLSALVITTVIYFLLLVPSVSTMGIIGAPLSYVAYQIVWLSSALYFLYSRRKLVY
jgi:O-antigen/teichoic acid export membrane protein